MVVGFRPVKTILVPVDGSESSNRAARFARELALPSGAGIVLLHVYDAPMAAQLGLASLPDEEAKRVRDSLAEGSFTAAEKQIADPRIPIRRHVALGHPAREIVGYAKHVNADVVVMGSRGRSEIEGLVLGSVSEHVVRHAHCPVTVVR